jgi:SAM-dependent methyltransferase
MTMRHHGEGSALWYRVFRYRWLEQQIAARPDVNRILDLGCGSGENTWRLAGRAQTVLALDVSHPRLQRARQYGPVVQGQATALPLADGSLDMIYAAHVLHHVAAPGDLLRQARRCLRPGGTLLLVETLEDHPLLRLGRALRPRWNGDAVHTRLRFADLLALVRDAGFSVLESGQYSVLFWVWELLPERAPWLDRLTPLFVALEVPLSRIARRWSAHGYCVAVPREGKLPGSCWQATSERLSANPTARPLQHIEELPGSF